MQKFEDNGARTDPGSEVPTGTWVAVGPAGAVGSVRRSGSEYRVELFGQEARPTSYPSLESAKRALHAAMGPNADRPEFHEH